MSSSAARSLPKIFTPTSDRTPVVNMSIRLMIGIVQMLDTPGICTARPSSARRRSIVMPGRHWLRGFRCTTVSVILSGAGSVDVSARAIFATAYSTSGKVMRMAFCVAAIFVFSPSEMLGSAIGMNIRSPSFKGGMNSLPIPRATNSAPTSSRPATEIVSRRCDSAPSRMGR